jgi:hypothetical protein
MKQLLLVAILAFSTSVTYAQITAHTTPDPFGGGSTTRFSDGSSAHTTPDPFGNGSTTRFSDGSSAHTTPDPFGGGNSTTYNNGY